MKMVLKFNYFPPGRQFMHNHIHLPTYRLPRVIKGDLRYEPLPDPYGRPLILACLHSLTEPACRMLETQSKDFTHNGWALALLLTQSFPATESWTRPIQELSIPMFTDPLKRVGRTLHLFHKLRQGRCETLIFNIQGYLQFRLIHDLNLRGFSTVLDIAKSDLVVPNPPARTNPFTIYQTPNRLPSVSSLKNQLQHGTETSGAYERSIENSETLA
jgi:hypothetical protein